VGASTGGFTDVLLTRGAARVYAIDVGYGQLADKLRADPRVVSMERLNARTLTAGTLPEPVDLAVIDVAFISLALVLGPVRSVLRGDAGIVALVKPQFEAGRADARGGVVRDREVHRRVLRTVAETAAGLGLGTRDVIPSPIRGPEGNREFLAWFVPGPSGEDLDARIDAAVAGAWEDEA
jgi:23S rRNA (cytidine1920-2'-O)/16S rRNA (cytidine1409-2'-O)-methyltransferase